MPRATDNFIPRFQILAEELIAEIKAGKYLEGQLFPSEKELVQRYQVSRQTIRNTLNVLAAKGLLLPKLARGHFVQAPQKSKRAPMAPPVSPGRIKQIGLVYRPLRLQNNVSFFRSSLGLKSAISQYGYSLAMSVACQDSENRLYPTFPQWIQNDLMDGYILLSAPSHVQESFVGLKVPVVCMGYPWTGLALPSVEFDFQAVYRKAVHYLVEKQCLPICNIVNGDNTIEDSAFSREVLSGYRKGIADLCLSPAQAGVAKFKKNTAQELVRCLARVIKKKPLPRAIILDSDIHLEPIMEFLTAKGIRVPQDLVILVILFNNGLSPYTGQIAFFDFDPFFNARRAGEKLLEIMHSGTPGELHERYADGRFVSPA